MILTEHIETNKSAFIEKVRAVSNQLGINSAWLMVVMYAESRLKPHAVNPKSNATGLIQFMPKTAQGLGTTVNALRVMTNVKQMDYVYKYFKPYRGKLHSVYDLYLVTFFPIALGKPDDWVMQAPGLSAKLIASQNPAIDINKDGKITVGEFKEYVEKILSSKNITLKKKRRIFSTKTIFPTLALIFFLYN